MMANNDEIFRRAAQGSLDAQHSMLDHIVTYMLTNGILRPEFLAVAEMWARMLSAHGLAEGKRRLAGVLIFKGSMHQLNNDDDAAASFFKEGFAILKNLAHTGDDRAQAQLLELGRRVASKTSVPGEIMLDEVGPTQH